MDDKDKLLLEIIKVFDYEILKFKVPKHLYLKKKLKDDIEKIFNFELVLDSKCEVMEIVGNSYSTSVINTEIILKECDINPIINFLTKILLKILCNDDQKKKIRYERIWINKMLKNSSVKSHTHRGYIDGVAIFYYSVPKNSSKFMVLKYDIDDVVKEEHNDIISYIPVETGDLIIHRPNVPHAVSDHLSDDPRICFIFEFELHE